MPRVAPVAAAVLLVAVAFLPYRHDLGLYACETDAVLWMTRGAPWNPRLGHWILADNHFVGWRPLTALSFTVNALLAGPDYPPGVYRWTDTLLHVAAALLMVPTGRALGLGPRAAWAAALVFAGHPAAEVVPYLSRRSYSLCVVASLGATLLHLRALRGGWGWGLGAVVATGLAVAANEIACLLLPWFLLLGLAARPPWGRLTGLWLAEVAAWAALFARRYQVVGKVGGYAFSDAGPERSLKVVRETFEFLWIPTSTWREPAWAASPLWLGAALLSAGGVVVLAARERRADGAWRFLLLFLAHLALYAWTGAWFFRMGYVPTVPLAWLLVATFRSAWALPGARRILALAPGFALGWIAARSPARVGVEPEALQFRERRHAQIAAMREDLAGLPPRAVVYVVAPHAQLQESNPLWNSDARYAMKYLYLWGSAFGEDRHLDVRPLAWVVTGGREDAVPELTETGVRFPGAVDTWLWPARKKERRREAEPWEVDWAALRAASGGRPTWVYRAADFPRELRRVP